MRACLSLCVPHACSARGGQERALGLAELESARGLAIVSSPEWVLGLSPGVFRRRRGEALLHYWSSMTVLSSAGPGAQAAAAAEGLAGGDRPSPSTTAVLLASLCTIAMPREALDHGA